MGRSPCCDKNGLKKGPWTPEEDLKLIQYIEAHGASSWRTLPKNAGLQRCGKSCRLRWTNYLRPDIKRGRFSFEEEETIIQLHSVLGNKWSAIAARLPGRTDNEIKNYWNTHIRKRLLKSGIDPVTHSPRLDLLDLSSLLNSSSSTQLNLSSLLGLQTLMNPELLKLLIATQLLSLTSSSNQDNTEIMMTKFHENHQQLLNAHQMLNQPTTNNILHQEVLPDVASFQSPACSSFGNLAAQGNNQMGDFQMFSTYLNPSSSFCGYGTSENLSVSQNSGQNIGMDSVLSTPLSGSPLNSSTLINNGGSTSTNTTEDESSYCSDWMKFEIPTSLDFDNFM